MVHPFLVTRSSDHTKSGGEHAQVAGYMLPTGSKVTRFDPEVLAALSASDEPVMGAVGGNELRGAVLRIIRDPAASKPMIVFALAHVNDVTILIAKHFLARDMIYVPSLRGRREITVFRDQLMRIDQEGEPSHWMRGRVMLSNPSRATSSNAQTDMLRSGWASGHMVEVANLGWVRIASAAERE